MKVPVRARADADLVAFLDTYREREGLGSRSEALERAIRSLRDRALEGAHAAAIDRLGPGPVGALPPALVAALDDALRLHLAL